MNGSITGVPEYGNTIPGRVVVTDAVGTEFYIDFDHKGLADITAEMVTSLMVYQGYRFQRVIYDV